MIKLELTEDEAAAMHQMIDDSIRSRGLAMAAAGHVVNQKLLAAVKAKQESDKMKAEADGPPKRKN